MEVTTRSESATDPVSVVFAAVCSFRRAMFSDSFVVPCPPGPSLASGKAGIDTYCGSHQGELLIDIGDRLYHAERLYITEGSSMECLCVEATQLVHIMREQLGMRFFNAHDTTRNLLESAPVLMSTVVSPGGAKLFKAVSRMLGTCGLYEKAALLLRGVCDRLVEPTNVETASPPAAPQGAPRGRGAWSSLPDYTDDEDSLGVEAPASTKAALAKAHLDECLQAVSTGKAKDPLQFWRENKGRYPTLYLVACAVLGAVATSAASERDFSVAGSVVRKDRAALLPRHLEMHTLIKENAHSIFNVGEVPKLTHAAADKICTSMPTGRPLQAPGGGDVSTSDEDGGD
eukprot:TRINITY_DN216_c0_g1_i6.p2 TRINITY_DN216_c0_g1~~TRINITY_DN216_c0_g1_i6.p2  ORF type:complete len:344 (+),score=52.97 TRINITY_DN216_c0_g1_i6:1720-2751(+)